MTNDATNERVKFLTVHLPCDFGLFNDILAFLTPLYPSDAKWSDCQESDGENITFYAPEDRATEQNQEAQG